MSTHATAPTLPTALAGLKVLTFPGVAATFCGYLLSHLGAQVTSIQDPGVPESVRFATAYRHNRVIMSHVLPDSLNDGHLDELLRAADVVVTDSVISGTPLVHYEQLQQVNTQVIHADISTFGSSGPLAGTPGGDLVATAASGYLQLTGEPGKAPVRMGADQALKLGGAEAASGITIALHHRDRTGSGQFVDVAVRDAMVRATVNALPRYRYERQIQQRVGDHWGVRDRPLKALWECADGWLSFVRRGGILGGRVNQATVKWLKEYGFHTSDLEGVDWNAVDLDLAADRQRLDQLDELFAEFLKTQPTQQAFEEGLQRGITLAPVRTMADVLQEPQLTHRHYWTKHEQPGPTEVQVPGYIVKTTSAFKAKRKHHAGTSII